MGRLVQLNVENFKSYGGSQTLGPFKSFTCVIGPNGAGKSNLMDAISFVLGIRSSQLRSSNLRELIHRKTLISVNDLSSSEMSDETVHSASVEAVIETANKTYQFKRTICDNGNSEYHMNGKSVRWAQYNETLKKLNIFVKARNFLVFQGDIEAIASQSPKELTKLIEQISGSEELKEEYERLKLHQERAAEASNLNFNKKRGIHAEIKQFKEQKDEAVKYEKLLEEKYNIIITHTLWKLYHIDEEISNIVESNKTNNSTYLQFKHDQTVIDDSWKELKKESAKLQKQKLRLEKDIAVDARKIGESKVDKMKMEEEMRHFEKKLKLNEIAEKKAIEGISEYESEVKELNAELEKVEKSFSKFEQTLEKTVDFDGVNLSNDQISQYQNLRAKVDEQIHDKLTEFKNLEYLESLKKAEIKNIDENLENLGRKRTNLENEKEVFGERHTRIGAFITNSNEGLKLMKEERENSRNTRKKLEQKERECEECLAKTYSLLAQVKYNKKESDRRQKLNSAIETLKRLYSGVHGFLSDLCQPRNQEVELAISKILGKHLDAIVVDDSKTAMECIQYLKEQQVGLATFLPLDSIQVKPVNPKFRSYGNGVSLAIDILQFDDVYKPIFEYACGNAIVCSSMSVARSICFDKNQNVKAVTLDGTIIHKSGLITGGTIEGDASSFSRWEEKEVDKLYKFKDKYESELNDIQLEKQGLSNDDEIDMKISSLYSQKEHAEEDFKVVQSKLVSLDKEIMAIQKEMKEMSKEKASHEINLTGIRHKMFEVDNYILNVEKKEFGTFCNAIGIESIRLFEGRTYKVQKENSEKNIAFATQISKLKNEIIFAEDHVTKAKERRNSVVKSIDEIQTKLKCLRHDYNSMIVENAKMQKHLDEKLETLQDVESKCSETNLKLNSKKRLVLECQREIDALSRNLISLESQIEKLYAERLAIFKKCKLGEIDIPIIEGSLENVISDESTADSTSMDVDVDTGSFKSNELSKSIKVNFKDLDDELKRDTREVVETQMMDKIKSITAEMERISPNLKAVEKLDGVESRLKQTNEEFEKTRKEAKKIRDQFQNIKRMRFEAFNSAYTSISNCIDKIYKELTSSNTHPLGGTAYLTLENAEEPYLDGIKYHTMPPMKRFRDMEQLSGGEKTMAALALLFAIHRYQPSPFFVMDEIDAALDNANVAKIAEYIRNHATENLQFIVISLKSNFYEKANGLAGVYRDVPEKTSKMLTFDLGKFED